MPSNVVAMRRVSPVQAHAGQSNIPVPDGQPVITQDDLVEFRLLEARALRLAKELHDTLASRNAKGRSIKTQLQAGVVVEDGLHIAFVSPGGGLVIA